MKSLTKKYYLYILIVLSSLTFYNPFGIIQPQYGKLLFYSICMISLIYAYKNGINIRKVKYPKVAYIILISGIIFSSFMALFFHEQSFMTSFIAIIPYLLGYLVFYILIKFNLPKEKIEKAIWTFCFIGMAIYIINMLTFPNITFGETKDEYDTSRGILRLNIFSLELIVLLFFYSINQWMITKKKKYIWLIFLTAVFIVLSVTRQYILLSSILGVCFILKKASLSKKIITLVLCFFVYFEVLPQIPMYRTMVELSEEQAERNKTEKEDIRITAWKFYTYEYQKNKFTAIFGNGVPSIGNSEWGDEFQKTIYFEYGGNGCFTSDVGWAGFYWNYGLFATIGLISLLLKAIFYRKQKNEEYLTYWCIFIFITSITSGPIIISKQIISIMTVLYIIFRNRINGMITK